MKRPELLAPAGSMDALIAAVNNGADAVYLGSTRFGARAYAGNFDEQQLRQAVHYCHQHEVKVYVTVNTLIFENELDDAKALIDFLYHTDVDALIVQDLGLVSWIRRAYPDFELHASTQMHIHNREGVRWVRQLGMKRAVLARETPVELVRECAEEGLDLEIFVYGALCVCYSGECLMSSINGGRSGNRGQCAQPCRLPYQLVERDSGRVIEAPGEYLLSPMDLNTLDQVEELIRSGATSFKIEGRMKRPEYVGAVVRAYREKIDAVLAGRQLASEEGEQIRLKKLFNRGFTTGYLFHQSGPALMNPLRPNHVGIRIGTVLSQRNGRVQVKLTAPLHQGDGLRILRENGEDIGFIANYIYKHDLLCAQGQPGEIIELPVREKVRPEAALLQTTDSELMKEIQAQSAQPARRTAVRFTIRGRVGEPMQVDVCDEMGFQAQARTEQVLQPAQKAPLDTGRLTQQLGKLNDTPFQLESVDNQLEGALFLPVQQINEARRQALDQLAQRRAVRYPERAQLQRQAVQPLTIHEKQPLPRLIVQIETREQAEALAELPVQLISSVPALIQAYPQIMPSTLRVQEHPVRYETEWLQAEEIGTLTRTTTRLICTSGFNVTNSEALALLLSQTSVEGVEFSLEINPMQQSAIREAFKEQYGFSAPTVQYVYGYRDLMVSKACPVNRLLKDGTKRNCQLCHQQAYALKNKKGELYPVFGDAACYSHCLEKTPFELKAGELDPHSAWKLRLTLEDGAASRQIVERFLRLRNRIQGE
ncbi:peptidase U32 family protein [Holdemania filiformis]|uniref:peptidase U32 family protein n=1 Tax=Holdemania filiformis TaxID=61171 RepID=UPI00266FB7E3|nr:U32 family peptidase [Holdemania filiformis]